ncbi:MAG TPA: hypothetical protein PLI21_01755 [Methanomassiliicoccaceae archaeon]|jgi:hypothetical protein|nr:hypothetical protein [Euryarchaeota archaeon]HOB37740.1 hypothetical protein [Methanomassiliicoccaceae archaeon]HOK27735.1 hypothetical protein [Methanomassiliicoccaceae archaeon]HOL06911.1 hypothetical protein [Methanomassiliicoccaceae archaeon]HPT73800.1 hypothetical protein [Methanomassiliicoccaceae archaeon]
MASGCRIEISYIDPETYAAIVNHDLRKSILRTLYAMTIDGPTTKQELADRLEVGYHQLSYQLTHQLQEFWRVKEERKIRGTRLELIEPSHPSSVFITLGRDGKLFMVDPLANLFGPLSNVGTRCDGCSPQEAKRCLLHVEKSPSFTGHPTDEEKRVLSNNERNEPLRAMDLAIVCALRGVSTGNRCVVSIPCESCPFLRRAIRIEDEVPVSGKP